MVSIGVGARGVQTGDRVRDMGIRVANGYDVGGCLITEYITRSYAGMLCPLWAFEVKKMYLRIKSGDLHNMKNFNVSLLNSILSVCQGVTITRTGILLDIGSVRVVLLEGNIGFIGDVDHIYTYDEVCIIWDNHDAETLTFIVKDGDTEVYIPVELDE